MATEATFANNSVFDEYGGDFDEYSEDLGATGKIIFSVVLSIIAFAGFIGNLIVVIVILKNKDMRNSINIYLLNLAIADILFVTRTPIVIRDIYDLHYTDLIGVLFQCKCSMHDLKL